MRLTISEKDIMRLLDRNPKVGIIVGVCAVLIAAAPIIDAIDRSKSKYLRSS